MTFKSLLALAVVVALASAQHAKSQEANSGPSATYKNPQRVFELDGNRGTFYKRQGGVWYKYDLVFEKKLQCNWPSGESFNGFVYKVKGYDVWYFLSDDTVPVEINGKTVRRYPIARSTESSNNGFFRIKVAGGTTKTGLAYSSMNYSAPTSSPEESEVEGGSGSTPR